MDTEGKVSEGVGNFGPVLRLFGKDRFREGQLPIVLAALAGKSVLVVSPTGSGKTLCFQLPAVLRSGLTMVVSPLKTLMSEQVSDLLATKVPATFINSDLSFDEKKIRFSLLRRGAIKLLYLAPERFFVRSEDERAGLKQTQPSFIVVDEAHCVDQWGRDFRREYGRLKEIREKLGSPPVLAFTATAGREMQQRILQSLGIEDVEVFVRDVDRPNIALLRWRCAAEQRAGEIGSLLRLPELKGQKAMVFVPSTKVGEELQAALGDLGLDVPLYHSKLGNAWERQELVKRFLGQSKPPVDQIICTNAFGMGLDVPNVRLVIHWQQSASVEDQLQEFGRAGRDGKAAVAVMFHAGASVGRDVSRLRFMAEKTVEAAHVPGLDRERMLGQRYHQIDQVSVLMRTWSCMRAAISEYFQGPKTARRQSLSVRILDWAFGTRTKSRRFRACCDHCDKAEIKRRGARDTLVGSSLARFHRSMIAGSGRCIGNVFLSWQFGRGMARRGGLLDSRLEGFGEATSDRDGRFAPQPSECAIRSLKAVVHVKSLHDVATPEARLPVLSANISRPNCCVVTTGGIISFGSRAACQGARKARGPLP